MKILITGHTGFIGSYLGIALLKQGHKLYGYSQDANFGGVFSKTNLESKFEEEVYADLNDFEKLNMFIEKTQPDLVFHLAAQRLVGLSYAQPLTTYKSNVLGTVALFEAVKTHSPSTKAIVVATTDKVYQNDGTKLQDFVENDTLGGNDPMSASKACCEIIAQSAAYCDDFPIRVVTARIGNAVGSFDKGDGLLLVDILNSFEKGENAKLRAPKAVRPWTSVTDIANGLSILGFKTAAGEINSGEAFNFGPKSENIQQVETMTLELAENWKRVFGADVSFDDLSSTNSFQEAKNLGLNSAKAKELLNWEASKTVAAIAAEIVELQFAEKTLSPQQLFEKISSLF